MSKTLVELRTEVRVRSDQEDTTAITDTNVDIMLNASLGRLRDMLMDLFGSDLFISPTPQSISVVSGTTDYTINSDVQKIIAARAVAGGYSYHMELAPWQELDFYQPNNSYLYHNLIRGNYKYQLFGTTLRVVRPQNTAFTINLHYIPKLTKLSSDSDTTPTVIEEQWLEWVILDCVVKIKNIFEEDARVEIALKQDIKDDIRSAARNRITKTVKMAPNVRNRIVRPGSWGTNI